METKMILHSHFMPAIHKTFTKLVQIITHSVSKIIYPEGLYIAERCNEKLNSSAAQNLCKTKRLKRHFKKN